MTMPEIGIHQGDDGVEVFQGLPSSHEGEIDSDEEERSVEPQAEEDACNSSGLRNRKMKSSRPGRELDGGGKRGLLPLSIEEFSFYMIREALVARFARDGIRWVLALLVLVCSRSFSGELYVNQHVNLHQNISEMRIVETPLHSVRSVAQDGTGVFKLARHDFLLLRTAGDKWYKAEKHGPSSGQAGIHFYPVPGPGAETIRFRSSISVDFSLAQALDILKDHKLDYSLWGENCWKYAHSRAEAILNSCIENASDDNVRNELKKELENLMDARRRMPNEVVDIVQQWTILWGVRLCFTGVFGRFWLGFGKNLVRRPSFFYLWGAVSFTLFALLFMSNRNLIFLTYNLTWLATTYRWHFNFLSFFGYYTGWTLCLRSAEAWILELEKHSEDPFLRTAAWERGDLDITISRANYLQDYANYHQEDSMEDQRIKWSPRTLVFGSVILDFVATFEESLGYSISTVNLRYFLVGLVLFGFCMSGGREVMRYIYRSSWTHSEHALVD